MCIPLPLVVDQFIVSTCAGKTNETPAAYRSKVTRLVKWMDAHQLQLRDLTLDHVEQFRMSLINQRTVTRGKRIVPGQLSPFTIHTVLRTVKHFLTWAHQQDLTCCDVAPFKIHPPPAPDPKPVTAENVLALLHAAARFGPMWERARNLAMLYMLRDTAGRISAILKADIDNLDLCNGKLYVREKGDKPHTLYLNAPTIQAVCTWLDFRPQLEPKDNALFISQRGTALKRSGFYSVLMRLREAAGLKGRGRTNPHAFRHAWVRDFLQACGDLSKASQALNHSTIRVTADYYARWADGELKDAHSQYSPGRRLPIIKPIKEQL
jgi:site-specific recombinase XerD